MKMRNNKNMQSNSRSKQANTNKSMNKNARSSKSSNAKNYDAK